MTRLRAVLFSLLSLSSLSASALDLFDGHTSIYGVRSAYTLEQGSYSYGFMAQTVYYQGAGNVLLPIQDMSMSFHQGVTNNFEVGMYFPARLAMGTNNVEFQNLGFALKYKTDETPATKDAVSLTLFGGFLSAPASRGVGSGFDNYGISIDYSNTFGRYKVHSNIGLEGSDSVTVTSATSGTFAVDTKMFWRMGAEMPFSETGSFNLGLEFGNDLSTNVTMLNILPSYTYQSTDKHLRYHLGVGYNLTPENNMPSFSAYAGINYSFDSPKKHIAELEHRIVVLEGMVNNLTTSQASQDEALALVDQRYSYLYENDLPGYNQRVDAVEKQIAELSQKQKTLAGMKSHAAAPMAAKPEPKMAAPAMAPVPVMKKPGKMHVEIINRSGDPKLQERIAKRLKDKGYVVVRSSSSKNHLKHSHVYYKNGYAEQAVTLGHVLPKNQVVLKAADLAKDVELRLVLGDDLK